MVVSPEQIGTKHAGREGSTGRRGRRSSRKLILTALVAPAFLLFGLFVVWPLLQAFGFSTFDWSGVGPLTNFVGFSNYTYLLFGSSFSHQFWQALVHNIYFFAISGGLSLVVALGLAYLLLIVGERGSQRYTMIFLVPFTLPPVVVSFIWGLYLEPNSGVVSTILTGLHLQFLDFPFLGSTSLALPTIAVLTAWIGMGFPVLVMLAALVEVPEDLLSAAAIDGAGRLRTLWSVLIPSIRPTLVLVTTLNFIAAFGTFDLIFVLEGTQAGPSGSTDVLGTLFYRTAFGGLYSTNQSMGLATAIAVVSFIIVLGVSAILLRLQRRFAD